MLAILYKKLSKNVGIPIAKLWALSKNCHRIFKPIILLFLESLWTCFLFRFVSIVKKNKTPLQKDTSICLWICASNIYYISTMYVPGTHLGIWRENLTKAWPLHTRSSQTWKQIVAYSCSSCVRDAQVWSLYLVAQGAGRRYCFTLVKLSCSGAWLSAQWTHEAECGGPLQRACLSEVDLDCPSSLGLLSINTNPIRAH